MRRLLFALALVAGALFPATGAFATPVPTAQSPTAKTDPGGIGIRLADAPVASRDNPRARVYIIDHVKPGTTVERRIEVSNHTGKDAEVAVYAAAAETRKGSFVGLEGETPNELSSWTTLSTPRLTLSDGAKKMIDVTIEVPSDAAPGEQYAVLWAQTTSAGGGGALTQVNRVGVRVYLSVGAGGEPASAFAIRSFAATREASGTPVVSAMIRNTGGRALDLRGELTLREGPGGLSAGPFPVKLGTTLGLGQTGAVTVALDRQLPDGPWKAHLEVSSGLLTETAEGTFTFSSTTQTVTVSEGSRLWWWLGLGALALVACLAAGYLVHRRRGVPGPPS